MIELPPDDPNDDIRTALELTEMDYSIGTPAGLLPRLARLRAASGDRSGLEPGDLSVSPPTAGTPAGSSNEQ